MPDPTPADLVLAVQAVQATSADCATEGPLLDRVNRYCAAQQHAEAVLRATFSTRELERLTGLLVDMHTDPLADDGQTLDSFVRNL